MIRRPRRQKKKGPEDANAARHVQNVQAFAVPAMMANNDLLTDTDGEVPRLYEYLASLGVEVTLCQHRPKHHSDPLIAVTDGLASCHW